MKERNTECTHRPVRTGALTLLMTAVLICLAVLAVLALATAQADMAMADKALSGLQSQSDVEIAGQEYLAKLDAALKKGSGVPSGATVANDGTMSVSLPMDKNTLQIVVRSKAPQTDDPAAYQILTWQLSTQWEPDQTLDLWNGM